jgi:hypothetical protein
MAINHVYHHYKLCNMLLYYRAYVTFQEHALPSYVTTELTLSQQRHGARARTLHYMKPADWFFEPSGLHKVISSISLVVRKFYITFITGETEQTGLSGYSHSFQGLPRALTTETV